MQPNCKVCGGTTVANKYKKAGDKKPDFVCNQDNGRCGTDSEVITASGTKVYFNPTPQWKPKEGGFEQHTKRPTPKTPQASPAMPPVKSYARSPLLAEDEPEGKTDWKLIGEQKNRSNLAAAILQGKDVDFDLLERVEAWVLTGEKPPTELDDIAANVPL